MKAKMKTKYLAYLFDFDGTLVDSMPTFTAVMLRILDEYGISYSDDIVKVITPLGYHGTAEHFRKLGVPLGTEELVGLMMRYATDEYTYRIQAKDKVAETLNFMKKNGISLNVLTASPHVMLDPCLGRLGILDLFDNVWSCDDFGTTKSDPKIYAQATEIIGRKIGETVFVDDNVNAIKTAKQAGMVCYGIFDPSSADYAEEMTAASDRYIISFAELLEEN